MRKLLFKCFLFIFFLLVVNTILFVIAQKLYFDEYDKYSLKYHAYMLGDSHGEALLEFLDKYNIYNFSHGSDSYTDMRRKLEFLLANNVDIKTIYITADDHTLSPYRNNGNEDRSIMFLTRDDSSFIDFYAGKNIKRFFVLNQPNILSVINMSLVADIKENIGVTNNVVNTDKEWSEKSVEKRMEEAKNRMASQFPAEECSQKMKDELLNIISICKRNGIKVIGIKFPLSSEYISVLDGKSYGADRLLISHGIPVLNYQDIFVEHDEYFKDMDHLNVVGAEAFVAILASDIKMK